MSTCMNLNQCTVVPRTNNYRGMSIFESQFLLFNTHILFWQIYPHIHGIFILLHGISGLSKRYLFFALQLFGTAGHDSQSCAGCLGAVGPPGAINDPFGHCFNITYFWWFEMLYYCFTHIWIYDFMIFGTSSTGESSDCDVLSTCFLDESWRKQDLVHPRHPFPSARPPKRPKDV